jgi:hypothetical protein
MQIISRNDAKLLGLKKYFTGVPCKNGHVSERYTDTFVCQQCVNGVRGSSQTTNLDVQIQTLRDRANTITIVVTKKYASLISEAERTYKIGMSNVNALLEQASDIENRKTEISKLNRNLEIEVENKKRLKQIRSELTTVYVMIKPEDKPLLESKLLTLLQSRCELLTIDDLRYRNKCEAGVRWQFKCHPEDKDEYIKIATELYTGNAYQPVIIGADNLPIIDENSNFNDYMEAPLS